MSDKFFLDTNIFVYSFDDSAAIKQSRSQQLIEEALQSGRGIISYQVVQEFLNVALKKFAKPFSLIDAQIFSNQVLRPLCGIFSSFTLIDTALLLGNKYNFSFYDCLIVAAAIEGKCKILYSEDLQAGMKIQNLQIINPF